MEKDSEIKAESLESGKAVQEAEKAALERKDNIKFLVKLGIMCAAIYVLLQCVWGIAIVRGNSMNPRYLNGDIMFFQRMGYDQPEYGDVIVLYQNKNENGTGGRNLIKRVIGLPGDTIEISVEKQKVYRNGEELDEPYVNPGHFKAGDMTGPIRVEDGHLFVLGDNRPNSMDSRYNDVGQVAYDDILGKCLFRIMHIPLKGET